MSRTTPERRYPRIAAPLGVYDVAAEPPEPMVTKNISLGGMFVLTRKRRTVGTTIEIVIEHGERRASAECRVTHQGADGIGLAFVYPTEQFLRFVQEVIDALLAEGGVVERRAESRAPIEALVVWSQTGAEHGGRVHNLSVHGALIDCQNPPELGSDVLVYLPGYTYDADSVHPSEARGCTARVIHEQQNGFGVRFVDPSAEFRMAVEAIIRDARARSHEA